MQTFTIEPVSTSGVGTYVLNLEGVVPTSFKTDIEVKLYKTTDEENNYVSITEGSVTQNGNQFTITDTINIVGSPNLIYEGVLSDGGNDR